MRSGFSIRRYRSGETSRQIVIDDNKRNAASGRIEVRDSVRHKRYYITIRNAAGMNPHGVFLNGALSSFLKESSKNAAIKKLTPAQEGPIRKLRSLLM